MLVLARKKGERIVIDLPEGKVIITFMGVQPGGFTARLGFEAPPGVRINRQEVWQKIQEEDARDQRGGQLDDQDGVSQTGS